MFQGVSSSSVCESVEVDGWRGREGGGEGGRNACLLACHRVYIAVQETPIDILTHMLTYPPVSSQRAVASCGAARSRAATPVTRPSSCTTFRPQHEQEEGAGYSHHRNFCSAPSGASAAQSPVSATSREPSRPPPKGAERRSARP